MNPNLRFPEYSEPEKTGDELYDTMVELAAYREWVRKAEQHKIDLDTYIANLLAMRTSTTSQITLNTAWVKKNLLNL